MVISKLMLQKVEEEKYKIIRGGWISSTRKHCGAFLRRIKASTQIKNNISCWYKTLDNERKSFLPGQFFEYKNCHAILEHNCLVVKANMDKSVYYSGFIQPLLLLQYKFHLPMAKMLEVVILIPWMTEPYKFNVVLRKWLKEEKLPKGCLTEAYIKDCMEEFNCINSGLFPRFSVSSGKEMAKSDIYESLRKLYNYVRDLNTSKEKISMSKLARDIQKCVKQCDPLNSQHLAQILIHVRIINQLEPATQAYIASTTNTSKTLSTMGLDESQSKKFLLQQWQDTLELKKVLLKMLSVSVSVKEWHTIFIFVDLGYFVLRKTNMGLLIFCMNIILWMPLDVYTEKGWHISLCTE